MNIFWKLFFREIIINEFYAPVRIYAFPPPLTPGFFPYSQKLLRVVCKKDPALEGPGPRGVPDDWTEYCARLFFALTDPRPADPIPFATHTHTQHLPPQTYSLSRFSIQYFRYHSDTLYSRCIFYSLIDPSNIFFNPYPPMSNFPTPPPPQWETPFLVEYFNDFSVPLSPILVSRPSPHFYVPRVQTGPTGFFSDLSFCLLANAPPPPKKTRKNRFIFWPDPTGLKGAFLYPSHPGEALKCAAGPL